MRTAYQKLRQQQWVLLLGNSPAQALNRTLGARRAGGMLVFGLVLTLGVAPPASAESLKDALSAAYGYNPRLDAQRAFQRATDEDVARAMSGYRPTVTGNADIGIERTDQRPSNLLDGVTKPRGYGIDAVQPIFSGFRTYNAVNTAEANVRAEREVLRDVERSVLLQAVTAYMDVVRDQELVRLNENNVNVLSRELKAAQDRFAVGEVTRTDVAQAEARRADAVSRLDAARANLRTSRGSYQLVIGHPPSGLAWPGTPEEFLPRGLNDAIGVSNNEDPLVVAALFREQAAKYTVEQIRGELLPTVQLEASYDDRFGTSKLTDEVETNDDCWPRHHPDLRGGRRLRPRAPGQAEPPRHFAADRAGADRADAECRCRLVAARSRPRPARIRSRGGGIRTRWRCKACARRKRLVSARCSTCSTPSSSTSIHR